MITRDDILKAQRLPGFTLAQGMEFKAENGGRWVPETGKHPAAWVWIQNGEIRRDMTDSRGRLLDELALDLKHPSNTGHLLALLGTERWPTLAHFRGRWVVHFDDNGHGASGATPGEAIVLVAMNLGRWPGGAA